MKYIIYLLLLLSLHANSQNDSIYKKYYYPNGNISSEGMLVNGKPDAYWKTYYENGIIKSEGNRKNFQLDSMWRFYDNESTIILSINYKEGKKHGIRTTYYKEETIKENFEYDIKQGESILYFKNGKIKKKMFFIDGKIEGNAYEYSENGRIITIYEYKKGYLINREKINRFNSNQLKTGIWKEFYKNGKISTETWYFNGKRNGFHKEYDKKGNLITIEKYINGEKQQDVKELKEYELRKDYYPNGQVKIIGSYYNDKPDGVRREYSEEGKIVKSYIFDKGFLVGEGIVDESGYKQSFWKEYYTTGELLAEGEYKDSEKIKQWKYYHKNGKTEQIGSYNKSGKATGNWKWYYESGKILKEEEFLNGLEEGFSKEYSENGKIIAEGEYLEGLEEGFWFYDINDNREEGKFFDGEKSGEWKQYYKQDSLIFIGKYINDTPDGRHVYYWTNGNKKREERYIMGIRNGEWKHYDKEGKLFLRIIYEDGTEIYYDNLKLKETTIEIEH